MKTVTTTFQSLKECFINKIFFEMLKNGDVINVTHSVKIISAVLENDCIIEFKNGHNHSSLLAQCIDIYQQRYNCIFRVISKKKYCLRLFMFRLSYLKD
jgi:hypothetical protein